MADSLDDLLAEVTNEYVNELWKKCARECFRIARQAMAVDDPPPIMLERAAQYAAIARCVYEHGWLMVEDECREAAIRCSSIGSVRTPSDTAIADLGE
jgi:hypothetical protein